jgi:hypothetical protein
MEAGSSPALGAIKFTQPQAQGKAITNKAIQSYQQSIIELQGVITLRGYRKIIKWLKVVKEKALGESTDQSKTLKGNC